MTKKLFALLIGLALTVPVSGQQTFRYVTTLADITVAGTAAGVFCTIGTTPCANVDAGNGHVAATLATCTLVTANIRVTIDGTTPTTNLGQVLTPGAWTFTGTDTLKNMQAIRDDSTSGVLSCTLYGQ